MRLLMALLAHLAVATAATSSPLATLADLDVLRDRLIEFYTNL